MRFGNPFRRSPARAQQLGPDSPICWKVGDMAVCNADGIWRELSGEPLPGPVLGEQLRVALVILVQGRQFLGFGTYNLECGYAYGARYFDRPREVSAETGMSVLRGLLRTERAKPREVEPV